VHPCSQNFKLLKPELDKSPLKSVFKSMPKGGALHEHWVATGNFNDIILNHVLEKYNIVINPNSNSNNLPFLNIVDSNYLCDRIQVGDCIKLED